METRDILETLIAFPTVSSEPNRALIDYCADLLKGAGARVAIIENETGTKANLFATIGPSDRSGVMLSGHTDVVPVEGQEWTRPAFQLSQDGGRLFGRGTTDMKGFVASALSAALKAAQRDLTTPLHLAFSYDEEIGCVGVRSMIDMMARAPVRPKFCIVGEPTQMAVATGHKGKTALRVTCHGREGHSALAPDALNAIYLATDLISEIRDFQTKISERGSRDTDYDVPFTTLHVGLIQGGVALNIVPNECQFRFEIRNLFEDDPNAILSEIKDRAQKILSPHLGRFPDAGIEFEVTNTYPPLGTGNEEPVVSFVRSLTGSNTTIKVAFGTEGGLFSDHLGLPTVVCGPGSMAQGHKPDEFIEISQLQRCDAMLAELVTRLEAGI